MTGVAGMFEFQMIAFTANLSLTFRFQTLDDLLTVHNIMIYTQIHTNQDVFLHKTKWASFLDVHFLTANKKSALYHVNTPRYEYLQPVSVSRHDISFP